MASFRSTFFNMQSLSFLICNLGVGVVIVIHISHGCSEDSDLVYIKPLAVFLVHIYCSTNGSFKKMCSLKKSSLKRCVH